MGLGRWTGALATRRPGTAALRWGRVGACVDVQGAADKRTPVPPCRPSSLGHASSFEEAFPQGNMLQLGVIGWPPRSGRCMRTGVVRSAGTNLVPLQRVVTALLTIVQPLHRLALALPFRAGRRQCTGRERPTT